MVYPATEDLSSAERAFMINASEIDILPGVWGDLPEPLASGPASELVPILLSLVDKVWINVSRVIPWTAPDGTAGFQPGPPLPRVSLPGLLADDSNWEYTADFEFMGALTLTLTEEGDRIQR
ncbi:hypothetical protein [Streptomyces sp. SS8]